MICIQQPCFKNLTKKEDFNMGGVGKGNVCLTRKESPTSNLLIV